MTFTKQEVITQPIPYSLQSQIVLNAKLCGINTDNLEFSEIFNRMDAESCKASVTNISALPPIHKEEKKLENYDFQAPLKKHSYNLCSNGEQGAKKY